MARIDLLISELNLQVASRIFEEVQCLTWSEKNLMLKFGDGDQIATFIITLHIAQKLVREWPEDSDLLTNDTHCKKVKILSYNAMYERLHSTT